jgi:hypothetical protein
MGFSLRMEEASYDTRLYASCLHAFSWLPPHALSHHKRTRLVFYFLKCMSSQLIRTCRSGNSAKIFVLYLSVHVYASNHGEDNTLGTSRRITQPY